MHGCGLFALGLPLNAIYSKERALRKKMEHLLSCAATPSRPSLTRLVRNSKGPRRSSTWASSHPDFGTYPYMADNFDTVADDDVQVEVPPPDIPPEGELSTPLPYSR